MEKVEKVVVHLSDWNDQDKAYSVPREVVKRLQEKAQLGQINLRADFLNQKGVELVKGVEDADFYLDWNNPIESIEEWEE